MEEKKEILMNKINKHFNIIFCILCILFINIILLLLCYLSYRSYDNCGGTEGIECLGALGPALFGMIIIGISVILILLLIAYGINIIATKNELKKLSMEVNHE